MNRKSKSDGTIAYAVRRVMNGRVLREIAYVFNRARAEAWADIARIEGAQNRHWGSYGEVRIVEVPR